MFKQCKTVDNLKHVQLLIVIKHPIPEGRNPPNPDVPYPAFPDFRTGFGHTPSKSTAAQNKIARIMKLGETYVVYMNKIISKLQSCFIHCRCVIDWNPGKNVTEKKIKEKQTRQSSATKFVTKTKKLDSFFNFFSVPSGDYDNFSYNDCTKCIINL
jgi:Nucleosome assembly protein (NAP)